MKCPSGNHRSLRAPRMGEDHPLGDDAAEPRELSRNVLGTHQLWVHGPTKRIDLDLEMLREQRELSFDLRSIIFAFQHLTAGFNCLEIGCFAVDAAMGYAHDAPRASTGL